MNVKKLLVKVLMPLLLTTSGMVAAPAAQAELTWFSRANCFNNESISWDWIWNDYYWLLTFSNHYHSAGAHQVSKGWEYTWRSFAGHPGEGTSGGWYVEGYHYTWDDYWGFSYLGSTAAVDCNFSAW